MKKVFKLPSKLYYMTVTIVLWRDVKKNKNTYSKVFDWILTLSSQTWHNDNGHSFVTVINSFHLESDKYNNNKWMKNIVVCLSHKKKI